MENTGIAWELIKTTIGKLRCCVGFCSCNKIIIKENYGFTWEPKENKRNIQVLQWNLLKRNENTGLEWEPIENARSVAWEPIENARKTQVLRWDL